MTASARKRALERLERLASRQLARPPDPDAIFLELPDADFLEIVVPGFRDLAARALPGVGSPPDYWQAYWRLAAEVVTYAEAGDFPTARARFRQFNQLQRHSLDNWQTILANLPPPPAPERPNS
jgi:hypothetical protein